MQAGASATYNPDSNVIESLLYVEDVNQDGDPVYYTDRVLSGTASLVYRDDVVLSTVSFDQQYSNVSGPVLLLWSQPPHVSSLSIQYSVSIYGLGNKTFSVPVLVETRSGLQLSDSPQRQFGARTEVSPYGQLTRKLDVDESAVAVLDPLLSRTLLRIDFQNVNPLITGTGPLYCTGGGRLAPSISDRGELVLLDSGFVGAAYSAATIAEQAATNLITNSAFRDGTVVPEGCSLTVSDSIRVVERSFISVAASVRLFRAVFAGSGPYTGPKTATLSGDSSVAIDRTKPVTFSIMAKRVLRRGTDPDVTLRLAWLNGTAANGTASATFDASSVASTTWTQLDLSVPSASIPANTTAANWFVDLSSIDADDSIEFSFLCPQIEQSPVGTSRIPTDGSAQTRAQDTIYIRQDNNINVLGGSIYVTFASGYTGSPVADSYLFDTRHPETLRNGYYAKHTSAGALVFGCVNADGDDQTVTASDEAFTAGAFVTYAFQFSDEYLRISNETEQLAELVTTIDTPVSTNNYIYFLSKANGTAQLTAELRSVEIWRD